MVKVQGLRALLEDETIVLFVGDDEEKLVMPALELAEALARLEEKPPSFLMGASDESEGFSDEPMVNERLPTPWQPPFPQDESESSEEGYRAAEVALMEPLGMLLLRRLFLRGEDLLEFDTPTGSVYEFEYTPLTEYLRGFLPR